MTLNCKPGQLATIVRGALMDPCVSRRIGCPVRVVRIAEPASLLGALAEFADGPWWELESAVSCPLGECGGLAVVPDRCLRPFDDGSEPAADDKPVEVERPVTTG